MFADLFVLSWILIALAHSLIALVQTSMALTHLNNTEKVHGLYNYQLVS